MQWIGIFEISVTFILNFLSSDSDMATFDLKFVNNFVSTKSL